ncbi:hypothetical protein ACFLRQ_02025 [Bacteroidota bacterium]
MLLLSSIKFRILRNRFSFLVITLVILAFAANLNAQLFTEQTGIVLTGIQNGEAKWGDYDNDDDLDILVVGANDLNDRIVKVYKNNGDSTFTEQSNILSPALPLIGMWGGKN